MSLVSFEDGPFNAILSLQGLGAHALALAPPSQEDGVVSAALAAPSDGVRRSDEAGAAEPALEGPLRANRPYGKRAAWPQGAVCRSEPLRRVEP